MSRSLTKAIKDCFFAMVDEIEISFLDSDLEISELEEPRGIRSGAIESLLENKGKCRR